MFLSETDLNPISWKRSLTSTLYTCKYPARNTTRWPNAGLMLAQRRRRWANISQHWVNVSCLLGSLLWITCKPYRWEDEQIVYPRWSIVSKHDTFKWWQRCKRRGPTLIKRVSADHVTVMDHMVLIIWSSEVDYFRPMFPWCSSLQT